MAFSPKKFFKIRLSEIASQAPLGPNMLKLHNEHSYTVVATPHSVQIASNLAPAVGAANTEGVSRYGGLVRCSAHGHGRFQTLARPGIARVKLW